MSDTTSLFQFLRRKLRLRRDDETIVSAQTYRMQRKRGRWEFKR